MLPACYLGPRDIRRRRVAWAGPTGPTMIDSRLDPDCTLNPAPDPRKETEKQNLPFTRPEALFATSVNFCGHDGNDRKEGIA